MLVGYYFDGKTKVNIGWSSESRKVDATKCLQRLIIGPVRFLQLELLFVVETSGGEQGTMAWFFMHRCIQTMFIYS